MNPAHFPYAVRLALVVAAAFVSGIMNAIAGGGTLLTFPALIGLGVPPIVANATSTVALWPGSLSSLWGYRRELRGASKWALGFAAPSLVGGAVGALLLLRTSPDAFSALVPWLIIGATSLFIIQAPLMRAIRRHSGSVTATRDVGGDDDAERTFHWPSLQILFYQLVVSIYGGYFGAGVGILMLAVLGFMGLRNIHRMNGLKNWGGACMNFVAAVMFAFSALVDWPVALAMAVGSTVGGYAGSRLAQWVGQRVVRAAVIAIGLGSGVWLLLGRLSA